MCAGMEGALLKWGLTHVCRDGGSPVEVGAHICASPADVMDLAEH